MKKRLIATSFVSFLALCFIAQPAYAVPSARVNIIDKSDKESFAEGSTQRITVKYQAYPYGGTVRGTLEAHVDSIDISNISPEPSANIRSEDQGKRFLKWDYTLAASETTAVSFDVKVPKKGLHGRDSFNIQAYASEGYNLRKWSIGAPEKKPTPTPVAKVATRAPGLTSAQVNSLFRSVYGRAPVSAELVYWHKRSVEKRTTTAMKGAMTFQKAMGKSPKEVAPKAPVVAQPIKLSEKEFRIGGISSLEVDPDDQEVDWVVTEAVKKKYPNVKIELCPGNDFKNCIILDAVAENDGNQDINMPPVPRVGKWYLHIIGRNTSDGLVPSVSISKRIEVQ